MSSRNYGKGNYGPDLDLSTTLVPIVCFVFYEMWAGSEKKLPFEQGQSFHCHLCSYNAVENDAHFVLKLSPL